MEPWISLYAGGEFCGAGDLMLVYLPLRRGLRGSLHRAGLGLLALLVACEPPGVSSKRPHDSGSPPGDDSDDPRDSGDTHDTEIPSSAPIFVLAGGGTEGELTDEGAWSARLYRHLLDHGDVTGDGLLRVAVLSAQKETDWLPAYFEGLGADQAFNLEIGSAEAAGSTSLGSTFEQLDAVFLKGGDQGVYYDLWNGQVIEDCLRALYERGGGIGGTSAGAMSLSEQSFAGGQDLISADVLEDSTTRYLDDESDGGSGVHDDFLGFVPGTLVDTHFTSRARLGRLAGLLALAIESSGDSSLLGLGIEEQTGLVIEEGLAQVIGAGSVTFLAPREGSAFRRVEGEPLVWTSLPMDVLTEGWSYDLGERRVLEERPPSGAEAVAWSGAVMENEGDWSVDGDLRAHEERFARVVERGPYATREGRDPPLLGDAIGIMRAHDDDFRGLQQESLLRALFDSIGTTGLLVADGVSLDRADPDAPERVSFRDNISSDEPLLSTIVIDTTGLRWRSLGPEPAPVDLGDASLSAAGLVGLRLHILGMTRVTGLAWDVQTRTLIEAE